MGHFSRALLGHFCQAPKGFESVFSNLSLQRLALLHLFRTYINTWVLFLMGHRPDVESLGMAPDYDLNWTLGELTSQSQEALESLLHKMAQLGLLTRTKANHYWMHPAIQMHLRSYFSRFYPDDQKADRARRAFAESIGIFGIQFTVGYGHGIRDKTIEALADEEDNFIHGLELSREGGWRQAEIGVLHGLFTLYEHTGRLDEWTELFEEVIPDFLDENAQPRQETEIWWVFIMDHRQRIAYRGKDMATAEKLARAIVAVEGARCADFKDQDSERLSYSQRASLRSLAIATGRLADVLRDQDNPECAALNEEALNLYKSAGDRLGISIRSFNLGHVYKNVPRLRDLDKAAQYYQEAYESYPEFDNLGRAQCLGQLGAISLERFKQCLAVEGEDDLLLKHFSDAVNYYETALEMEPADAVSNRGTSHNQLGIAYKYLIPEQERAFEHFRMAAQYFAASGEVFENAGARLNAAQVLEGLGRFDEAREYAREALALFEPLARARSMAEFTDRLISRLDHQISGDADDSSG